MKNTFIEELRKYERKALDPWVSKNCSGRIAASTNLRMLIVQVTELKNRMAGYRPLLSDDIVVAFESLLWLNQLAFINFNITFWLIILFQIKIKLHKIMVSTISEETHHKMSKKIA